MLLKGTYHRLSKAYCNNHGGSRWDSYIIVLGYWEAMIAVCSWFNATDHNKNEKSKASSRIVIAPK